MSTLEAVNGILGRMEEAMRERLGKLGKEFSALRTGRATPLLVEPVRVDYYGQSVPLKQVAAISVPEGRVLEIRPWDAALLSDIEKALQKADVGAHPQNDGKLIRLNLPPMSEDRRKEMVKIVRKMAEEYRVALRADRHEALEKVRKSAKAGELGEDDVRGIEGRIQKTLDSLIKQVDEQLALKEKEITAV